MKLTRPVMLSTGLMMFSIGLAFTIRSGFDRLAIFLGGAVVDTTLARATLLQDISLCSMALSGLCIAFAFSREPAKTTLRDRELS